MMTHRLKKSYRLMPHFLNKKKSNGSTYSSSMRYFILAEPLSRQLLRDDNSGTKK